MTSSIYRGANVVLLCFDITDEASFRACREGYLADVRRYAPRTVKVALVGCRKDLATGERQRVSTDAIRQFAAANSFPYFETSALTGEGTSELLDWLIEQAHPGRAVQAHQVSESAERKQRSGSAISRMKESLSGTNRNSAAASS
jgi:GTPase SAR1 family protein